ncbi:hypothetical protein GRF29_77g189558 [Pseudopithomyces chartarum]|uniref:Uncharacterized protein n=1 Tax=Pseudopithomyces chartarum TaxID=1892770 RepID=A0AAN6LZM3_9PLEO|nr:hypothetical protein GRF29_77g189558 [Pseudopithomyces chartarum]
MEPQTSSSAPKPDPTSTPVPPEAKPMNLTSDADNAPPLPNHPPHPRPNLKTSSKKPPSTQQSKSLPLTGSSYMNPTTTP